MFSKIWATKLNYEKQTDLFASNDAHGVYMLVYEEETGKKIAKTVRSEQIRLLIKRGF